MQALFLRRNELAEYLGMSQKKAVEVCAAHGVQPVDLGAGRGRGLRWRTSAVKTVADALHAEANIQPALPHRPRKVHALLGRSLDELYAEFNRGDTAPVQ